MIYNMNTFCCPVANTPRELFVIFTGSFVQLGQHPYVTIRDLQRFGNDAASAIDGSELPNSA